ncbi:Fibrinogen-like protein 1 [Acipenser ruthenus]|uniref:Fibrinogen-like protein 1 n=1 Tax=Acipenser ruthenus TaxID=7906 RepID=A0A662YK30_ACIRT|nr:Fibrinogen-like protein 1 [Acipenser ruthenus]
MFYPQESESCLLDISELQRKIKGLQNQLLIGEWQMKELRENSWMYSRVLSQNSTKEINEHITLLPTTSGNLIVYDHDCSMLYDRQKAPSGYYRIKPKTAAEPFLVYCDMEDGGGWTILQRRRNGGVDFNRGWSDYKDGFGHFKMKNDEYWLGNEHMYTLLLSGKITVGNNSIMPDNYRLQFGLYSGTAGDALSGGGNVEQQWSASHNSMQFSTPDADHDRFIQGNCAKENKGGWWFNRCHAANLNGKYYKRGEYKAKHDNGVLWFTWRGWWHSLKFTTMKVRPPYFMDSLGSGDGGPI